jgi:hypothetical protein
MRAAVADARRFRSLSGRVHELAPGMTMTMRCGVNMAVLEPTEELVTCLSCMAGKRGRHPRPAGEHEALQATIIRAETETSRRRATGPRALLAESDRLLEVVEQINVRAVAEEGTRWIGGRGRAHGYWSVPDPAPAIPRRLGWRIARLLRRVGIDVVPPARTDTAQERIYQAQVEIFPRLHPGRPRIYDEPDEEVAVGG